MKKNKKYFLIDNGPGMTVVDVTDLFFPFSIFDVEQIELENFLCSSLESEICQIYAFLEERNSQLWYRKLWTHGVSIDIPFLKRSFPLLEIVDVSDLDSRNVFVVKAMGGVEFCLDVTGRNFSFQQEADLIKLLNAEGKKYNEMVQIFKNLGKPLHLLTFFPTDTDSVLAYVDEYGDQTLVYPLFGHKIKEFEEYVISVQPSKEVVFVKKQMVFIFNNKHSITPYIDYYKDDYTIDHFFCPEEWEKEKANHADVDLIVLGDYFPGDGFDVKCGYSRGLEFYEEIIKDPFYANIPIIILSEMLNYEKQILDCFGDFRKTDSFYSTSSFGIEQFNMLLSKI
jgi:hypothetical protein